MQSCSKFVVEYAADLTATRAEKRACESETHEARSSGNTSSRQESRPLRRQLLTYIAHARAKNRAEGAVHRHWHHVQGVWNDCVHVNLSSDSVTDSHVIQCQLMIPEVELRNLKPLVELLLRCKGCFRDARPFVSLKPPRMCRRPPRHKQPDVCRV